LLVGDLNALLEKAAGVVVVNSTVGLSAIQAARPTIVLGRAIYDLNGLGYQGTLDTFWMDALKPENKPDDKLFRAFRDSLITLTQVNGDFYTKKGVRMAVSGCIPRLVGQAFYKHPENQIPTETVLSDEACNKA